jgi:DNA-binding phage protein
MRSVPEEHMPGAFTDIARVLTGARRRQLRIVLAAAAAAGAAAALLCLLGGATALALGARTGIARTLALSGVAAAVLAAVALATRALVRTAWDDVAAARTVAAGEPALRSALLSSVELGRERERIARDHHFSVALVDAHLDATAARARAVDLARAVPDRRARQAGVALLAVAAIHALAFLAGGRTLGQAYARVLGGDPPGTPPPQVDPITGDIEITYAYPAYMKREPRTLSGTGGELRAPKGTEVTLRTRADRPVKAAEVALSFEAGAITAQQAAPAQDASGEAAASGSARPEPVERRADAKDPAPPAAPEQPFVIRHQALTVTGERGLEGRFMVDASGSYRFRFLDGKGRPVAEGPPVPITMEPDAFPQVSLTAPEREVEVDHDATVGIAWDAEDDFGLSEVTLVLKLPSGKEDRRVLRRGDGLRRDGGTADLALATLKLAEGEKVLYWIEAADNDTVSGPKKSVSDTQTIKIYSEAEHRRQVLEEARQLFEEMVTILGDRLDTLAGGGAATPEKFPAAQALDARARTLHEGMRAASVRIRRDPASPRELAAALGNVAGGLRVAEQRLTQYRAMVGQSLRARVRPDASLARAMTAADDALDRELEKGILYLEQLLDKRRAEDLVALAKDLAKKRRDLANLAEKYQKTPTEQGKKELLAEIGRMKERVRDLLQRMSELSKGFNDEHMNEEALEELAKSQDLMGGLDEAEKKLAQGDVEGALKALDQMASAMDQMVAGLQRTAGLPDEKAAALMKEMLAFKAELEKVESEQRKTAGETEKVRAEYRKKAAERMKDAEKKLAQLAEKAKEAREDLDRAQQGVSMRAEPEYEQAREAVRDLQRALEMREVEGAAEAVMRAQPSVERLAQFLEEDAQLGERSEALTGRDPERIADAQKSASRAAPKVREIRDALSQLLPDPRSVLGKEDQKRLGELAKRQGELEQQAGQLQQQLRELAEKAPVFPPSAQDQLGESRGHMGQASAELGAKNPQRGRGEQELALDALGRLKKGLEDAARQQQGGQGGQGFPFPFAEAGGENGGEGMEPSREKVKIPGAEAHRVPEEFRKDLLEAMKQGAPERYRGEVQRYYEELVK